MSVNFQHTTWHYMPVESHVTDLEHWFMLHGYIHKGYPLPHHITYCSKHWHWPQADLVFWCYSDACQESNVIYLSECKPLIQHFRPHAHGQNMQVSLLIGNNKLVCVPGQLNNLFLTNMAIGKYRNKTKGTGKILLFSTTVVNITPNY